MDLANYLVPVNADVADLDAICVEEDDLHVNALGVKESANSLCSVSHQRS